MKILYLIDNFSLGGAQTVVKGLMEHGMEKHKIFAIALREKEPLTHIDHPNILTFPSRSKYTFKVVRFLKDFISENKIDILHCQLPRSILIGYLLKRAIPDIKYIIHEQGDVFESRTYALLLRIFKKRADGILTCSKATANMLIRRSHIKSRLIKVLYNFVDLQRFSPAKPSAFHGKNIAFAGRIEKRKGWREFVGAAISLKDRKELSFYLAGTGTEEKKLTRFIGKHKDAYISYVGFVADMKDFYQKMDLLVIPSHFEPMGMVAVEAMACGIPVLATDVPGLNEIVSHKVNGWTYPSQSVSELSMAIMEILDSNPEERDFIIEHGINDAQKFSLLEFSRKLLEYYTTLK